MLKLTHPKMKYLQRCNKLWGRSTQKYYCMSLSSSFCRSRAEECYRQTGPICCSEWAGVWEDDNGEAEGQPQVLLSLWGRILQLLQVQTRYGTTAAYVFKRVIRLSSTVLLKSLLWMLRWLVALSSPVLSQQMNNTYWRIAVWSAWMGHLDMNHVIRLLVVTLETELYKIR